MVQCAASPCRSGCMGTHQIDRSNGLHTVACCFRVARIGGTPPNVWLELACVHLWRRTMWKSVMPKRMPGTGGIQTRQANIVGIVPKATIRPGPCYNISGGGTTRHPLFPQLFTPHQRWWASTSWLPFKRPQRLYGTRLSKGQRYVFCVVTSVAGDR